MTILSNITGVRLGTVEDLAALVPGRARPWSALLERTEGHYLSALAASEEALIKNGVRTARRLAHFLGQGNVETGGFRQREENLNYSAARLRQVFSAYRHAEDLAERHAGRPVLIAHTVYQNHPALGNTQPGDGFRFRGRGFIQLTGRSNYERYALVSGLPIDTDPDLISRDLKASIAVAAAFWHANGLSRFADVDDASAVSRGVNRGDPFHRRPAHAEARRVRTTRHCLQVLTAEQQR